MVGDDGSTGYIRGAVLELTNPVSITIDCISGDKMTDKVVDDDAVDRVNKDVLQ